MYEEYNKIIVRISNECKLDNQMQCNSPSYKLSHR